MLPAQRAREPAGARARLRGARDLQNQGPAQLPVLPARLEPQSLPLQLLPLCL